MFLLGLNRNWTALALCKSIESAIQWFQKQNIITFAAIQNSAVYPLGARVSIFLTLVPLRCVTYFLLFIFLIRWIIKHDKKHENIHLSLGI